VEDEIDKVVTQRVEAIHRIIECKAEDRNRTVETCIPDNDAGIRHVSNPRPIMGHEHARKLPEMADRTVLGHQGNVVVAESRRDPIKVGDNRQKKKRDTH
jgi:hypothetical protein